MTQLFETIKRLVAADRYLVGQHAFERLEERRILEWHAVSGLDDGVLIVERPKAKPNPIVEVRQALPDGTVFKAVWSHLRSPGLAKLYFARQRRRQRRVGVTHRPHTVCGGFHPPYKCLTSARVRYSYRSLLR